MRAVVAATKLTIPRSREPRVPRPDLDELLDGDYRIGLVSAPAGYGKTATLSSWALDRPDPVAWLSCDPSDAEPTRFTSCLLAAISTCWPGAADDAFVVLDRDGAAVRDAAVAAANELAAADQGGVVVVDDLHLARPSRTVLAAFIDALPGHVRFVAGTRSDPPLSLARWRLAGELLELRTDDLRFDHAEMAALFALRDLPMSDDELGRLHELTEGWPAGAQLAMIALRRGVGYDTFVEALATTDRAVGDFLVTEVLDQLPPDLCTFLTETSVLDAFDVELCHAVAGVEHADAMLQHLVSDSLFVVPLDERAHAYRYHHLFGAFLRARLASMGTARLHAAHDRACRALEDRGDTAAALRHCLVLGDVERAGQILRTALRRSHTMSDGADAAVRAVRLWLHELGPAFIETDPAWVVELVTELIVLTGADDAPPWLERVRRAHPHAGGGLTALLEVAWSEHHQHRGQPLAAIECLRIAADALAATRPGDRPVPLLPVATARAHIQAGDLEQAGAVLERSLADPVGIPVADDVRHPGMAAYVAAAAGALTHAGELAAGADHAADQLGLGGDEPGRIFAGLAQFEVHVERNELEDATRVLDDVVAASEQSHQLTLRCLVGVHEARLARVLGDEARAEELLARTRLGYADPDASVRRVFAEEAVAHALQFDPARAGALIAGLDPDRVATQVLRARLALLERDDDGAAQVLDDLPSPTTRRGHVERAVLRALSRLERDVDAANGHLTDALLAGQPERFTRTIVDHGPLVHKLLLSCTPPDAQAPYVEDLLAVTSHMVAPVRARPVRMLPEPLSVRETTVLRYLCSRLTYREIAAALYVSLNTLKSHVRNVYRKLDAESREAAVEAGRRCGLI
jgi:LuxR family maltose regulon positive regulatory protein